MTPHAKTWKVDGSGLPGERTLRLLIGVMAFFEAASLPTAPRSAVAQPAEILVVDAENNWPVPLVELTTTHSMRFVTDNAGVIAIDAPELLDREVWYRIKGHGYGVPADGFGNRGIRLTLKPGQRRVVKVQRQLPAKRVGRLTGAGLFGESQQLGRQLDWRESGVFGCDSVQTAVYRDRLFWVWGDTTLPRYPLGIFNASAATTPLRPADAWRPPLRWPAQYRYFRDAEGAPRGVADIAGEGPTWLSGLIALPDEAGNSRLCACYDKIRGRLTAYERGLCLWDDQDDAFRKDSVLWSRDGDGDPPLAPTGHAVLWTDEAGESWALFGDPFPHLRCRATLASWRDPSAWDLLTPQRDVPVAGESRRVVPHRGAIAYNDFRGRWVALFCEKLGEPSAFGELWYCEADQPTGPWGPAVKVVTHENYTFYNPAVHPELVPSGSPILLFEATYTAMFADHANPTPRYDYNQVLYRLDLDDAALAPARTPPARESQR